MAHAAAAEVGFRKRQKIFTGFYADDGGPDISYYFENYPAGAMSCGAVLGPMLWMHTLALLSDELEATSATCRLLAELVEDEDLWRRFCLRETIGRRLCFCGSWRNTASAQLTAAAIGASRFAPPSFPPPLGLPGLPVLSWEDLTSTEFLNNFDRPRQPFVIRNALAEVISTPTDWTCSALLQRYGDREFHCVAQEPGNGPHRHVQMRLKDYCEYASNHSDLEPLYLFDGELPAELLSSVKAPRFLGKDYFGALQGTRFEERWWLAIGGVQSGTRFHVDPFETSAWNLVTEGRKRWILFPPSASPPLLEWRQDGSFVSPGAAVWFQMLDEDTKEVCSCQGGLEVEQGPGDFLFVPRGWWHCVANLELTVAFTQNIITSANSLSAAKALEQLDPGVGRVLREAIGEDHNNTGYITGGA